MTEQSFSTEKRVLMAMRKTLAKVVRDLTPSDSATQYPLSDDTVEDIKVCFDLISSRERELMQIEGKASTEKPRFIDDTSTPQTVAVDSIAKTAGRQANSGAGDD